MKQHPKMSIIIPCYKVEKFIGECLNSVISQTYQDYEVICINDGSPDTTLEILLQYQLRDSRIKVYSQINGGVTCARRYGVERATGEWITFLDGDDTLPNDGLENLIKHESDDTDIIIGFEANPKTQFPDGVDADTYRRYSIAGWFFPTAPWAKLIRKSLFDAHTLDIPREIVYGEDLLMNIRLSFNNKKRVTVVPKVVYNYRQQEEGVARRFELTEEYECFYHLYFLNSIPQNIRTQYSKEIFLEDYSNLLCLIRNSKGGKNYKWRQSQLYQRILNEIIESTLKISIKQRIILYGKPICLIEKYLI